MTRKVVVGNEPKRGGLLGRLFTHAKARAEFTKRLKCHVCAKPAVEKYLHDMLAQVLREPTKARDAGICMTDLFEELAQKFPEYASERGSTTRRRRMDRFRSHLRTHEVELYKRWTDAGLSQ